VPLQITSIAFSFSPSQFSAVCRVLAAAFEMFLDFREPAEIEVHALESMIAKSNRPVSHRIEI
jgi:hypothetical protein